MRYKQLVLDKLERMNQLMASLKLEVNRPTTYETFEKIMEGFETTIEEITTLVDREDQQ